MVKSASETKVENIKQLKKHSREDKEGGGDLVTKSR